MMNIVMLGNVGAGKGTQAQRMASHFSIPHISTGEMFREAVRTKTELGLQAEKIMADGGLVPDDIVLGIVNDRINQPDAEKGYILDGFPRTQIQAAEFERFGSIDHVIYISVDEEEVIRRLRGRRFCEDCKTPYNIYLDDAVNDNCSSCGGALQTRDDDDEETVRIRMKNYINQTMPLIEYYRERNLLRVIDGNRSIEKIYADIIGTIETG